MDGTIGHVSIVDGTRTINIDNDDRVILKAGQSLSITVDGPALENLAILPEFPVTKFSLEEEDPLSSEQLAGLQKLRILREVWIQCPAFNDDAIKALEATNTIQVLNLLQSSITDAGCESLKGFPHLKTLNLRGSNITDEGISKLASFRELETVLLPPHLTDFGLPLFVENNKQIKKMDLSKIRITDKGLECLGQLLHLEELILRETTIGDNGVAYLANIRSLRTLDLSNTQISDAVLNTLSSFQNLDTLDLSHTKITGKGLSKLAVTKLKYLGLDYACLTDNAIPELVKIEKLRSVSLIGTRVSDLALRELAKIKDLESVDLPVQASEEFTELIEKSNPGCQVFLISEFSQEMNPGSAIETNDIPCGPEYSH